MPQHKLPAVEGRPDGDSRLRAVVDNSPIVLVAFDAAGTITLAEGWDLTTFGVLAASLVGMQLAGLGTGCRTASRRCGGHLPAKPAT